MKRFFGLVLFIAFILIALKALNRRETQSSVDALEAPNGNHSSEAVIIKKNIVPEQRMAPLIAVNEKSSFTEVGDQVKNGAVDLKQKYPQIKEVLFRVPMSDEIWAARLQKMPVDIKARLEKSGSRPETAILTPDDQPIIGSDSIKPTSECPALNEAPSAITVSVNEKGQVQDAVNTDPENNAPIPEGLYACTFQPNTAQGSTGAFVTALSPPSELKAVAQMLREAYRGVSSTH